MIADILVFYGEPSHYEHRARLDPLCALQPSRHTFHHRYALPGRRIVTGHAKWKGFVVSQLFRYIFLIPVRCKGNSTCIAHSFYLLLSVRLFFNSVPSLLTH